VKLNPSPDHVDEFFSRVLTLSSDFRHAPGLNGHDDRKQALLGNIAAQHLETVLLRRQLKTFVPSRHGSHSRPERGLLVVDQVFQGQIQAVTEFHDSLESDIDKPVLEFRQRRRTYAGLPAQIFQGPVVLSANLPHT
jgi:hypothetical protein